MKHILGVSAGFHDAALTLINDHGDIEFAGHSERYSKIKNDENLSLGLLHEVTKYNVQHIAYYERPWAKQLRQLYAGQGIEWNKLTAKQILTNQIGQEFRAFPSDRISTHNHHLSHAAAGFQTSTFDRATVVVIDAIGEWDTISIWGAKYDRKGKATYKKLWRQTYPHSIGLFYSAVTSRIGLRPLDEEYITMGMAAWGKPNWYESMTNSVVKNTQSVTMHNNYHTGLPENFLEAATNEDIACAAQMVAEDLISQVMQRARDFGWSNNLVYMGGVALNCLANRNLGKWFDRIWIMPCPGDAGSSLGAAALAYGRPINWVNAYLGHNIAGEYPVQALLDELSTNRIAGVASGRAEFGPRALGNRSLLADPRGRRIKDQVNEIKRRQKFRPFAPVILEELADTYFDMPRGFSNSRYMQCISSCRRPDLFPAIIHVDGTSRVQTVPQDGSGIRKLLEAWYELTGCPMLLNTSLNIRGEPMVNDRADADRFEQLYGVRVFS
jgi:carbamoyltransferase